MSVSKQNRVFHTYSSLSAFRNCRQKYDYRYNQRLVPIERNETLFYGTVWHECLERLYRFQHEGIPLDDETRAHVFAAIDEAYPNHHTDPQMHNAWHHLRAMLAAYLDRWSEEDAQFEVIGVEQEFEAPIATFSRQKERKGSLTTSRKYWMRGKVDAIVRRDNQIWILEHKTAASLTGDYLERLPSDAQIHLYARYLEKAFDYPVTGIVYNVSVKSRIQQSQGETEEEFEERRAALIAKSKTGTTSAKRKVPESDEDFASRLRTKYRENGMFHREDLYIAREDLEVLEADIAELNKQITTSLRQGRWYKNTDHCFHWNRPCPYFPLCRSNDSELIREKFFQEEAPHSELTQSETDAESIF